MTPAEVIRDLSSPLSPLPTDVTPQLTSIAGIRAVLFDVYGTLFISASGDISLTSGASRGTAAQQACAAAGLTIVHNSGDDVVAALHAEIKQQHNDSDTEFPEVEIRDVWRAVIDQLIQQQRIEGSISADGIDRLAVEYESRVNPAWAMPGLLETLSAIEQAGLSMGIVSNAQAFTRELFPALTGKKLSELGFSDELCIWSYEQLQAKPGKYLYQLAVNQLQRRKIRADEVLYIGNDMRNDVAPAATVGFRTALFAGDARSLRLREGDPLVAGVSADAILTDLRQVLQILRLAPRPE